ncbi:hypothetical protein Ae717Ps2_7178 [Pseudonocardia sp. Ae717_Ps2]|nr:hypothetical protein Ae717Ps2_7178 [Pseudonocardia sp. Ae717_Ps2]
MIDDGRLLARFARDPGSPRDEHGAPDRPTEAVPRPG